MTIRALRLYLEYEDQVIARAMNRAHFGVTYWFDSRLKRIREELRGAEAKGVDIANILFFEDRAHDRPQDSWRHRANAFEYGLAYDVTSLVGRDPVENIKQLTKIAAERCASAPWPQVRAIGNVLQRPLDQEDVRELRLCLERWSRLVDRASAQGLD